MVIGLDLRYLKLREQVRGLLATHELPREEPVRMWSGAGHRNPCSVCQLPILPEQTELELQFCIQPGHIDLRFHRHCYVAWELERCGI